MRLKNINGLKKIEDLFNKYFDFNNLITQANKYIKETLPESDTNFLSEDDEIANESYPLKQLRIEYNKTHLLINNVGSMPYFRLEFYLYEQQAEYPKYIYEIEYNSYGEFLDEYFMKY